MYGAQPSVMWYEKIKGIIPFQSSKRMQILHQPESMKKQKQQTQSRNHIPTAMWSCSASMYLLMSPKKQLQIIATPPNASET